MSPGQQLSRCPNRNLERDPYPELGATLRTWRGSSWDTGVRLNDNPVVVFRLLVTLEDGTSYEAETKNVVSVVHIPQVQPGAVLPVKVDPDNKQLVALDISVEHQ